MLVVASDLLKDPELLMLLFEIPVIKFFFTYAVVIYWVVTTCLQNNCLQIPAQPFWFGKDSLHFESGQNGWHSVDFIFKLISWYENGCTLILISVKWLLKFAPICLN